MKYSLEFTSNFIHPQHKLKFEYTEFPFWCDGCKEIGIGSKYKCSTCNYHFHKHCALPCASFVHPFYTKCCFQFLERPPGLVERYCNACLKRVSGFMYHCSSCGFDVHPCCANLPMVLDDGELKLELRSKMSAVCYTCGKKGIGIGWSYRSTCKKYNLHVACVKGMLVEARHDLYNCEGGTVKISSDTGIDEFKKLDTGLPSLKAILHNFHKNSMRMHT
ncbi:hypothetical protein DCAR_0103851 [Daucus carota subsp. sativus]|uniref:Uncharacterized protein n=1 Tax=Daucus carota subsp. sativus TaxID=79200 RepID=A0A166IC83_DAUCS|nr:PREDICTED: uncharacterized protein LOC108192878 [Daucus carota subsp. sativus]WOG84667.1 hypothetical protein DCAR_0103851 [Daucus carota subsp. sativus]